MALSENAKPGSPRIRWTDSLTKIFIANIGENYAALQSGSRKEVFEKIAKVMNTTNNLDLTWLICQNKWKSLLRGFKNVKDHNAKSGNGRKE